MKNPIVIGRKNDHEIVDLQIELPQKGPHTLRAICLDKGDNVVEVCESNDANALVEHLSDNYQIAPSLCRGVIAFRYNYDQRVVAAEEMNAEEDKKFGGLHHQFIAGPVIYSIVGYAKHRIAQTNADDKVIDAYFEAFAQKLHEDDPDEALIDSAVFDTIYEATTWIRNHIEKAVFNCFMPGVTSK